MRAGRAGRAEQHAEQPDQQPGRRREQPPCLRGSLAPRRGPLEAIGCTGSINGHAGNAPRWLGGAPHQGRGAGRCGAETRGQEVVVGTVAIVPRTPDNFGSAYHLRL
ncbi:hypothetical protein Ani05nite_59610 [Amorphoplanes nipponensis]|uniref:Uncharacterized protein n=1 Tax=Actinoplanes nipponensis TaxID=135950 RepID=A0A919JN70_9ACTN|nr:hypothetical protein Ani05nite_59610 [Actinoplanes nipponensis]